MAKTTVRIKRVYDEPAKDDGVRVLVDRLWPRGVKKENAHLDAWIKEVSPSDELRKWFGHDPDKWPEFQKRYGKELAGHDDALAELKKLGRGKTMTLVYGAKDEEHNNAVVLKRKLEGR